MPPPFVAAVLLRIVLEVTVSGPAASIAPPLVAELRVRITEELDYELEAASQNAFATAYADDDEILVPRVVAATPRILVTEWIDGKPLSQVISSGTPDERDVAGLRLATLHFSAPTRVGLLHADPHPGNFRLMPDDRLGVLDFGAVARLDGADLKVNTLTLHFTSSAPSACCPLCGHASLRVRSRYPRMLRDLPCQGRLARLRPALTVLAIDDPRLVRVKPQAHLLHPHGDPAQARG